MSVPTQMERFTNTAVVNLLIEATVHVRLRRMYSVLNISFILRNLNDKVISVINSMVPVSMLLNKIPVHIVCYSSTEDQGNCPTSGFRRGIVWLAADTPNTRTITASFYQFNQALQPM